MQLWILKLNSNMKHLLSLTQQPVKTHRYKNIDLNNKFINLFLNNEIFTNWASPAFLLVLRED